MKLKKMSEKKKFLLLEDVNGQLFYIESKLKEFDSKYNFCIPKTCYILLDKVKEKISNLNVYIMEEPR